MLCFGVPPAPVYKGGEEEAGQQGARQGEGSPTRTPVLVGFGPTLFPSTGGGKGEGEGVGEGKGGGAPFPSPIRPPPLWGAHQSLVGWLASLLWPIRPISFLGGNSNAEKCPNHSEPFRCPNATFQYMNLYLSTISRLLLMSVISSGTPNKLRYIKSHNS